MVIVVGSAVVEVVVDAVVDGVVEGVDDVDDDDDASEVVEFGAKWRVDSRGSDVPSVVLAGNSVMFEDGPALCSFTTSL